MAPDRAEQVALHALAFVAGSDDLATVFLGSTGVTAGELARRAADREILLAVLDFLTMNDAWVRDFCDSAGFDYSDPMTARSVLAGPAETHWT